MNWIILALIPPFIWAFVNVMNKIVRTKHIDSSITYMIIAGPVNLIYIFGFLFLKISTPNIALALFALFTGIMQAIAALCYIKALSIDEVSRVIPLMRLESIFVIIFATLLINEILIPIKYLAFFLILIGGFLISLKKFKGVFSLSKAFYFMVLSSFLWGTSDVFIKYLSRFMDFQSYFMFSRIGAFIFAVALFLIPKFRFNALNNIQRLSKKVLPMILLAEIIGIGGMIIFFYAISIAPVTLVNVLLGFQPFFVLIIASFLSFKFPQILREELNKKVLLTKIFAIILLFVGLFLIQNGVY